MAHSCRGGVEKREELIPNVKKTVETYNMELECKGLFFVSSRATLGWSQFAEAVSLLLQATFYFAFTNIKFFDW